MMWVVVGIVTLLMLKAGTARALVPSKLQSLAELLVDFIRGIIHDTMGASGMRFFPLISALFLFILFSRPP
ncbi:MAG: F0F1 ATP synthase subunit A, partial [Nitrospirota bacterium]|nr:F0F1 ATP synthase subunit A [Nitrospirota bacterium]